MAMIDRQLRHATREISYAHSAKSKAGRAVIRTVENLTGRVSLIRRAKGYEAEVASGRNFWDVMFERYGLDLDILAGSLETLPQNGPLKEAVSFLKDGGAIGLFPGGTVSTAITPFGQPLDPGWRTFTAKMIASSGATVVPIFFSGHNSRLFQVASHLHYTLRVALLIKEFKKQVGSRVPIVVGDPIAPQEIERRAGSPRDLMGSSFSLL